MARLLKALQGARKYETIATVRAVIEEGASVGPAFNGEGKLYGLSFDYNDGSQPIRIAFSKPMQEMIDKEEMTAEQAVHYDIVEFEGDFTDPNTGETSPRTYRRIAFPQTQSITIDSKAFLDKADELGEASVRKVDISAVKGFSDDIMKLMQQTMDAVGTN